MKRERGSEVPDAWTRRWARWTSAYAFAAGGDFVTTYLALLLVPGAVEGNPRVRPVIGTPLHVLLLLGEVAFFALLFLMYAYLRWRGCRLAEYLAIGLIALRSLPVINNVCVLLGFNTPIPLLFNHLQQLLG